MRTILFASAALISMFSYTQAADIGVEAAPAPVAYAAEPSWTGFYLGVSGGLGMFSADVTEYQEETTNYGSVQLDEFGGVYGVQAGFNYQFGNAVIGLEGDFSGTTFDEDFWYDDRDYVFSSEWDWLATVRARAGLAIGNALVYATGGVAFVDQKTIVSDDPTDPDDTQVSDDIRTGLVAGVGAEFMVTNNFTVKGEYLFVGLEDDTVFTADDDDATVDSDAHIIRVGVNYLFNWQ